MARFARTVSRQRKSRYQQAVVETLESRQLMSTTYYVATTGNDNNAGTSAAPYKTLQNAVQYLKAGDTLIVRAGSYQGFICGWDGVNQGAYSQINGTAGNPITIEADPNAAPGTVIINSRNNKTPIGIDFEPGDTGCNYINVNGFTITSNGSISLYGIKVAQSNHVNVTNLDVHGVGATGIFTSFATDGTISNNKSYNNGEHGIYASNSPQNDIITNNICHDNSSGGIQVNADQSQGGLGTSAGMLISNNIIYNNGANGGGALNMDGLKNSIIENNLLYNNHSSGLVLYDGDASEGCTGNLVVNNTIIQASGARQALNDNTNSFGNIFFNNIFLGNMLADSSSTPAAFSHNILLTGFSIDGGYTFSGATTSTAAALFTNVGSNDYTLKSGSIAIDAGLGTLNSKAAPGTDLLGAPRPNGSGWDVGAYEAQTGPDTTPPTLSVVIGTATSPTTATITWTTNESSDSQVVFGKTTSYGTSTTLDTTMVTSHSVTLSNLSTSTTYHFEVKSKDASGNLATSTDFTFATPAPDTTKPTATVTAADVTSSGGTSYTFTVTFADNVGLDISTIDSSDVLVTGPNSFSQTATFVSLDTNSNGTPRTATYSITPAGGSWDSTDVGTYTITLQASQVADTSGNFVTAGALGTFDVTTPDTTKPTASPTAANVTTGGGTTYTFTVTYSDNVAISVATIDSSDVKVTGPNSFSQTATLISVDVNTDGTPRTATYRINTPGGTWDTADNGTYTVAMKASQVADTSGNFVATGAIGTFTVNITATDTTAPTASLTAANVTTGGGTTYNFTVTFSDNVAIDVSTLGTNDVTVTGPNSFSQIATFVSVNTNTNGTPRTATYQITTPGGSWNSADNGTYTVSMAASEVADTAGNFVAAGALGTFTATIAVPDTTAPTASLTSAPSVTTSGGTTYTFTVTFSDNVAVNVSTLGTGDVTVTGPNSFSAKATFVSVNTNTNGTPRTATYRINTPGGTWNFADTGTYTVSMVASQVADTSGNFVAAGSLGTFAVDIAAPDTTAPTATLNAADITTGGGGTYTFTVTYSDNVAINVSSLGSTDVTVTGPGGFSQAATFISVDTNTNGTPRTATYRITAPGGAWDMVDNGTFTVTLGNNQVTDTSGNAVAAGALGTFAANVPDTIAPTTTFNAPTVTNPGDTTYTFTVTYHDNVAVDATTLDSNDILITGPHGFSQTAVLVSLDGASDTPQRTATYQITSPDSVGGWSNSDNGVYTISVVAGEVSDTNGNTMPAGSIGTFLVNDPDTVVPQATLTTAPDVNGTGTSYIFTVTYTDDEAIDVTSLGNNDVMVTGPGGVSQFATFVSVDDNTNGTPRVATYKFTPPGGSWNMADNGIYTISMKAGGINDIVLNPVDGGVLGTFSVDAPDLTRLPTHVSFKQSFVTTTAGQTLNTVTVSVLDSLNRVVTDNTSDITIDINTGPNGSTIMGTLTVSAEAGVATFTDLELDQSGSYTLIAHDGGLVAGKSVAFAVRADATTSHLVLMQQPADTAVGKVAGPALLVAVEDQFGNLVTTSSRVTLSLVSGPGLVRGAVSAVTVGGIAHFVNNSFSAVGSYAMELNDTGVADTTPVDYTQNVTMAASVVRAPVAALAYTFGRPIALSTVMTSNSPLASVRFTGTATITDQNDTVLGTVNVGSLGGLRFTLVGVAPGTYTCKVNYSGDANHTAVSSPTFTLTVNPAASAALLAASPASGQSFTLTASVVAPGNSGGARTGTVTFMDGVNIIGTANVDDTSKATLVINNPTPGLHTYTAVYSGDSNYKQSTSAIHRITVVVTGGESPTLRLIGG